MFNRISYPKWQQQTPNRQNYFASNGPQNFDFEELDKWENDITSD